MYFGGVRVEIEADSSTAPRACGACGACSAWGTSTAQMSGDARATCTVRSAARAARPKCARSLGERRSLSRFHHKRAGLGAAIWAAERVLRTAMTCKGSLPAQCIESPAF